MWKTGPAALMGWAEAAQQAVRYLVTDEHVVSEGLCPRCIVRLEVVGYSGRCPACGCYWRFDPSEEPCVQMWWSTSQ